MTAGVRIVALVDEGLGNSSYVVDLGDGRALAVDASLDLRALRAGAEKAGLRVAFAADTHLHADFLSGAVALAATDGAQVLASATGGREFPHRGLADGEEVDLGGLTLRALVTPGHTFEHVSFVLSDGARPVAVFTGGSLLVGSAGRTDLAGTEHAVELARAQFRSLRRLLTLPDELAVYPTHGAGSFCAAPPGADRVTTIGRERTTNPLLATPDEDAFVTALIGGQGSYPPYFDRLAEVNRRGPGLGPAAGLAALGAADVDALRARGATVVDVRPFTEFAAGHVPGALSIQLRAAFATWLGWLADPGRPLVVVRDPGQDPDEIVWQAAKIGYARLAGELDGGMAAWRAAGLPVAGNAVVDVRELGTDPVLDVRQAGEFRGGHVPGARHAELGDVATRAASLPGPLATMCGHGERAATAASVLERAGRPGVRIVAGGPDGWAAATGCPLEAGG